MSGTLARSYCPEALNFFLNHSKIYPNIAPDGAGYLDATELLKQDTYFFNFGDGAVLFMKSGDDYKGDCYFLRNKGAKAKIQQAIEFMFHEGARKIIAEAPTFNKPSRHMIVSLGFERTGISPAAWIKHGISYDVIQYELVNKWAA